MTTEQYYSSVLGLPVSTKNTFIDIDDSPLPAKRSERRLNTWAAAKVRADADDASGGEEPFDHSPDASTIAPDMGYGRSSTKAETPASNWYFSDDHSEGDATLPEMLCPKRAARRSQTWDAKQVAFIEVDDDFMLLDVKRTERRPKTWSARLMPLEWDVFEQPDSSSMSAATSKPPPGLSPSPALEVPDANARAPFTRQMSDGGFGHRVTTKNSFIHIDGDEGEPPVAQRQNRRSNTWAPRAGQLADPDDEVPDSPTTRPPTAAEFFSEALGVPVATADNVAPLGWPVPDAADAPQAIQRDARRTKTWTMKQVAFVEVADEPLVPKRRSERRSNTWNPMWEREAQHVPVAKPLRLDADVAAGGGGAAPQRHEPYGGTGPPTAAAPSPYTAWTLPTALPTPFPDTTSPPSPQPDSPKTPKSPAAWGPLPAGLVSPSSAKLSMSSSVLGMPITLKNTFIDIKDTPEEARRTGRRSKTWGADKTEEGSGDEPQPTSSMQAPRFAAAARPPPPAPAPPQPTPDAFQPVPVGIQATGAAALRGAPAPAPLPEPRGPGGEAWGCQPPLAAAAPKAPPQESALAGIVADLANVLRSRGLMMPAATASPPPGTSRPDALGAWVSDVWPHPADASSPTGAAATAWAAANVPLPACDPAAAGIYSPAAIAAVAAAPQPAEGEPPSVGSQVHEEGMCTPCCYYAIGVCKNGAACSFCHYEHVGMKWKRSRPPKHVRSRLKVLAPGVADGFTFAVA